MTSIAMPNLNPSPKPPRVVVFLPNALTRMFPGSQQRVEFDAATIEEVLRQLDQRWPGMYDRLCDSTPRIRRHINIFVAGERAMLHTRLAPGAEIYVLTAISGG